MVWKSKSLLKLSTTQLELNRNRMGAVRMTNNLGGKEFLNQKQAQNPV